MVPNTTVINRLVKVKNPELPKTIKADLLKGAQNMFLLIADDSVMLKQHLYIGVYQHTKFKLRKIRKRNTCNLI